MTIGPEPRDRRRRSYDEGADEPPGLIESETTDVEMEHPTDDTEVVEQVEDEKATALPMFEE